MFATTTRPRPKPSGRGPSLLAAALTRSKVAMARDVVGYTLLVLLALQYGTQPFLTSRFLSRAGCDSRAVVLVTELAKAALCACSLGLQRSPAGRRRVRAARDVLQTAAPAACYLVQNLAMQRAYADLDSLTFNCLNQTKLVATAFFLFVLLRQRQSGQQLVALAMLLLAGLLLQLTGEQRAASSAGAVKNFRRGVAVRGGVTPRCWPALTSLRAQACLLASALSGLASTLTQISLQARCLSCCGVARHFVADTSRTHSCSSAAEARLRSRLKWCVWQQRNAVHCVVANLATLRFAVASHRSRPSPFFGVVGRRSCARLGACAYVFRGIAQHTALTKRVCSSDTPATRLDSRFVHARLVAGAGRHYRWVGYETARRHQQGVCSRWRPCHHWCASELA